MNVFLCDDLYKDHLEDFLNIFPSGIKFVSFSPSDIDQPNLFENAEIIITRWDIPEDIFRLAISLRVIIIPMAGYEFFNYDLAMSYGVRVCNNGGANARSVAEHTLMLILGVYRHLNFHQQSIYSGSFESLKYSNEEIKDKTLGIVGMGNIGRQLALITKHLVKSVVYYDITRLERDTEEFFGIKYMEFENLNESVDVLSLHVPHNSKSHHMINKTTLNKMKENAVVINTSRGSVVHEKDLIQSLKVNKIWGAGLDVFEKEPLSVDSEFLNLDNVFLTPHCAPSKQSRYNLIDHISEVIQAVEGNKTIPFRIKETL